MAKGRSLSILERNQRVIGGVAVALMIAGTAFALLLQGGVFTAKYRVTAFFSDAAGIRAGDLVTVAGLQAGLVEDLQVESGQVAMVLGVEEDVDLPEDSRARIVIETLLGRKSVALLPGKSTQPLEDGDVIPQDRTTTPVDIPDLNNISVRLLNESDADAFDQFLAEVTKITKGRANDVQAIVQGLERVTAAVDARQSQLEGLIDSLRVLATTFGERDQRIISLIDNLDVVLGHLARRQEELRELLLATDAASHETADLVVRNREALDSTLDNLHRDLKVLNRHQLDIAATVAYLEQAVHGYSSVGYSARGRFRNEWANIFVQSLGPAGVDAVLGPCGALDRLVDHYFGTNCAGDGGIGTGAPGSPVASQLSAGPGRNRPPSQPEAPALPCTIDDLVDTALLGAERMPVGSGRCTP